MKDDVDGLGPMPAEHPSAPRVSVVVPAYNEGENLRPLVEEILAALEGDWQDCEVVLVDDGSNDDTATVAGSLCAGEPRVRYLRHHRNSGQSAAVWTGVVAATSPLIVTLDGDGQNDPASIPDLLLRYITLQGPAPLLICGIRVDRRDTLQKRLASRAANRIRRWLLDDEVSDSGCGLKVFARGDFLALPMFNHMHRFLPALMKAAGARIESVPVRHRARTRGVSKYGVGGRALVGVYDLIGVAWLMRRRLHTGGSLVPERRPWTETAPPPGAATQTEMR